jgi:hypothetical protein
MTTLPVSAPGPDSDAVTVSDAFGYRRHHVTT